MRFPERKGPTLTWAHCIYRAAILPEDALVTRFLDQAEPASDTPKKAAPKGVEVELEVASDGFYLLSIDPYVALDAAAIPAPSARKAQAI